MSLANLRLDEISYLGKLRFLIPHHWVEDSEEDHSCFHEEGAESGFLRVSLITQTLPGTGNLDEVRRMMQRDRSNGEEFAQVGDNVVVSYEAEAKSDPSSYIYWWLVGGLVSKDIIREAVFSYTVSKSVKNLSETQEMVKLVGELVSKAEFKDPVQ